MEGGKLGDADFILQIMDRLEFFGLFTNFEKRRLVEHYRHVIVCDEDETIIEEGEDDCCFYVILSGRVQVRKGHHFTVAVLGPGEIFGEISFLSKTPRAATVSTLEETIVIQVNDRLFEKLDPETREKIKDKIIDKLIQRLVRMNGTLQKLLLGRSHGSHDYIAHEEL
ncbi:hypothetical protein BVX99_00440 [bacterium F16]|nr:hypothetical protein BVX99_00440 [bacterium F16]